MEALFIVSVPVYLLWNILLIPEYRIANSSDLYLGLGELY